DDEGNSGSRQRRRVAHGDRSWLVADIKPFPRPDRLPDPVPHAHVERHVARLQHAVEPFRTPQQRRLRPFDDTQTCQLLGGGARSSLVIGEKGYIMTGRQKARPLICDPCFTDVFTIAGRRDEKQPCHLRTPSMHPCASVLSAGGQTPAVLPPVSPSFRQECLPATL